MEEMTGEMDAKTNFNLIVIQTELERWKYLVRGYLRARIAKVCTPAITGLIYLGSLELPANFALFQIDKHTLHYLSTPETRSLLSSQEVAYATRHQTLLQGHYNSSFMSFFPASLRNLNDTAGGISMIDKPDTETAVFIRLLRDTLVEGRGRDADDQMEGRAGEVVVVRWADVKELVKNGDAELV